MKSLFNLRLFSICSFFDSNSFHEPVHCFKILLNLSLIFFARALAIETDVNLFYDALFIRKECGRVTGEIVELSTKFPSNICFVCAPAIQKGLCDSKSILKKGEIYADGLKEKFNGLYDDMSEKFEQVKDEVSQLAHKGKAKIDQAEKEIKAANN